MKGNIKIVNRACVICPTCYDVILPDGKDGYVKFRYGYISLYEDDSHNLILSEQISDQYDGFIELGGIIKWLEKNGYNVSIDDALYQQLENHSP